LRFDGNEGQKEMKEVRKSGESGSHFVSLDFSQNGDFNEDDKIVTGERK